MVLEKNEKPLFKRFFGILQISTDFYDQLSNLRRNNPCLRPGFFEI